MKIVHSLDLLSLLADNTTFSAKKNTDMEIISNFTSGISNVINFKSSFAN